MYLVPLVLLILLVAIVEESGSVLTGPAHGCSPCRGAASRSRCSARWRSTWPSPPDLPPPKALKPKKQKAVRGGDGVVDTVAAEEVEAVTAEADDAVADEPVEQTVTAAVDTEADGVDGDAEAEAEAGETVEEADAPRRRLRNRRPSGKGRGGGVALSTEYGTHRPPRRIRRRSRSGHSTRRRRIRDFPLTG